MPTCTDHAIAATGCPASKPFLVVCEDCGKHYCSNIPQGFQCRSCYLYDEWQAGLL